jgi:hypothetical protein
VLAACSAPAARPSTPGASITQAPSTPAAPPVTPAPPAAPAAAPSTEPAPAAAVGPLAPTKLLKLASSTAFEVTGLGFDANHALYVAGELSGQLQLDSASLRSAASDYRAQVFVARIHPHGEVDWLVRVGASHAADLAAASVASDGSVALVGRYSRPQAPGREHIEPAPLDAFVILVGADGKVRWERRIDSVQRELATSVHRTADGAVLVAGTFAGATRFGPKHRATSVPGSPIPSVDFFLARFSPAGDVEWLATGGGPDNDRIADLTVGATGDICIAGDLGRDVVVGAAPHTIRLTGAPLPPSGVASFRSFVACFSPSGVLRWAVETGSPKESSTATLLRALADGSLLVHGWEQDPYGARTDFLAHLGARGNLLHRRGVPELDAVFADDAHVLSVRSNGSSAIFERHTAAATAEVSHLLFSAADVRIAALGRGGDGRVVMAWTTGRPRIPHDASPLGYDDVAVHLALAPSLGALRAP